MIRTFKFVNVTYVAIVDGETVENTIKVVFKNVAQVKKQIRDMFGEVLIKNISDPEVKVFRLDDYEFLNVAKEETEEG